METVRERLSAAAARRADRTPRQGCTRGAAWGPTAMVRPPGSVVTAVHVSYLPFTSLTMITCPPLRARRPGPDRAPGAGDLGVAITMKAIATPKIGQRPDAAGFDPDLGLAFSSNGEGTLSIVKLVNGKHDTGRHRDHRTRRPHHRRGHPKLHRVYILAAEYGPPPAGGGRARDAPGQFPCAGSGKVTPRSAPRRGHTSAMKRAAGKSWRPEAFPLAMIVA